MASLEDVFIKEFKRNIRGMSITKDIYNIPLPKEVSSWEVSGSDVLAIKGIGSEGELYAKLNKSLAKKLPKDMVASRRKVDLVTRSFVRDKNNRYVYEDVKVPTGSIVILSSISLDLPYGYKPKDNGFGYIDFVVNGDEKEFIYYIPKRYVYQTNQSALALSVKNMKNFSGMGYLTWKFGTVYLHIIPYKPNQKYVGTKILKTGHKLNYSEEVKKIVDFWVDKDVIPNILLCNTINEGNLVLKETSIGFESYEPLEEISISDREIYGESREEG